MKNGGTIKMNKINILISEEEIQKRIKEIAGQIEKDYENEELIFLGILKGSVPFMWELAKNMKKNVQFEFIEVSSYKGTESTGKITLNKDISKSIENNN